MSNPASPWHLWGGAQVVALEQVAAGGLPVQTVELGKVSYKRPETFGFFLGARLLGGDTVPGPGPDEVIFVRFHLYLGVGRTMFRDKDPGNEGFCRMLWSVPPLVTPGNGNINNAKYTTRVRSPWLEDTDHTTYELIDHVCAETINCEAECGFFAAAVGQKVQVEITALFAPWVHVRPDWFSDNEWEPQFRGGETGGS